MAVSSPALLDALTEIVTPAHLIDSTAALEAWSVDGMTPRWVARPGSAEEVGRLVAFRLAYRRAQIGGVLATNASGPLRLRHGTARDLTLGVRFVQADGTLTWGGAKVVKSVTGYDVPKLLVGSFGTIGIIVAAAK